MERNVAFLQDIQEAYASLANLTMVLIDQEGKRVTDISFRDDFSKMIFARHKAREAVVKAMEPLGTIKTAMLLDSISGAKYILSPINVNNKLTYYLFAGYIFEESSRNFVQVNMETLKEEPLKVANALEAVSENTDEEKHEKMELVKKASDIMSDYLTLHDEKSRNNKKFGVIQQSLELIRQDGVIADTLVKDILSTNSNIDFIGLALEGKEGNGDYCVEYIEGLNTEWMRDHAFVLGEGFLGHTIAIEQFQFWKNASMDPRYLLFKKFGMKIKSLFCIPVFGDHQVKGAYFGGSYENELEEKGSREHAKLNASILSIVLTTKNLRTDLQNHLMELSTFNEIFRVITSVEDIKRVLYILVDISINVIRGPFACIVSKPIDHNSKVEIVSRGLTAEKINDYGSDVAYRVSNQRTDHLDVSQPEVNQTSWGEKVLEFPLVFNDHFYGVLCVGCHPKSNQENYESFLSSLAVAGSISMHLHKNDRSSVSSEYVFTMLQSILSQLGPEKHTRTMRIREIAEGFTNRYYKDQQKILSQASLLVEYNSEIVEEVVRDASIKSALIEFYKRNDQTSITNKGSEILSLIHAYVEQGENINVLGDLPHISDELKNQFFEYVSHQDVVVSQISLSRHESGGLPIMKRVDAKDLKEITQLSVREIDVLNLVLKGHSNMEIASELFISDHTVKNHMTKILQKLGVTDRSQAIAKVYKLGYSPAED
jgi:DNA-binding CsgD family transcriptional regulator/ligand-binding sensor protein